VVPKIINQYTILENRGSHFLEVKNKKVKSSLGFSSGGHIKAKDYVIHCKIILSINLQTQGDSCGLIAGRLKRPRELFLVEAEAETETWR
jgi:hypothetical protein